MEPGPRARGGGVTASCPRRGDDTCDFRNGSGPRPIPRTAAWVGEGVLRVPTEADVSHNLVIVFEEKEKLPFAR